MKVGKVLVGCDPEIFVKRTKDGHFVSAHGMVPGTKKEPYRVDRGAVQVDGMALEFNIDPAHSEDEFYGNVTTVLAQLRDMLPPGHEFALVPTATFTKAHFDEQPDEAKELGCEPDYNAYTLQANPRPNNTTYMRTASGHIHLGYEDRSDVGSQAHLVKCATLVKHLDAYLGVPSLLFDKDQQRRRMYGRPGAFRPKPYGVEYRVLSNAWLNDEKYIRWVYRNAVRAVHDCAEIKGDVLDKIVNYFNPGYAPNIERLRQYMSYINFNRKTYNLSRVLEGFPE